MSKEGSAMAQMGDNAACERVYKNLNNSFFFDSKLQLGLVWDTWKIMGKEALFHTGSLTSISVDQVLGNKGL